MVDYSISAWENGYRARERECTIERHLALSAGEADLMVFALSALNRTQPELREQSNRLRERLLAAAREATGVSR